MNIITPELVAGCGEFIARCQTYEGGLGGYPGVEAHGGYTFCALAAAALINKLELLDLRNLTVGSTCTCVGGLRLCFPLSKRFHTLEMDCLATNAHGRRLPRENK